MTDVGRPSPWWCCHSWAGGLGGLRKVSEREPSEQVSKQGFHMASASGPALISPHDSKL